MEIPSGEANRISSFIRQRMIFGHALNGEKLKSPAGRHRRFLFPTYAGLCL